jgi:hypothetical protein
VNETLHKIGNDNTVRVVNFATSKNIIIKSAMFPHRNIHKFTWTFSGGKNRNKVDYILIDKTGYVLDDRGVGVRVPVGSRIFSSPHRPRPVL